MWAIMQKFLMWLCKSVLITLQNQDIIFAPPEVVKEFAPPYNPVAVAGESRSVLNIVDFSLRYRIPCT